MKIYQADLTRDAIHVRELFWEYMQWANEKINETYGINFDIKTMLEEDILQLAKFMPPKGRLLLCFADEELAGLACLRDNGDSIGEIKRMYVRPAFRRQGVGRALLNHLLEEAGVVGYRCIRLDSAGFMSDAHRLYHSLGFQDIAPYAGSEIPPEFQANWVFMEKALS